MTVMFVPMSQYFITKSHQLKWQVTVKSLTDLFSQIRLKDRSKLCRAALTGHKPPGVGTLLVPSDEAFGGRKSRGIS